VADGGARKPRAPAGVKKVAPASALAALFDAEAGVRALRASTR
jgi:hypothetical protein